jgi:hypothetical protein
MRGGAGYDGFQIDNFKITGNALPAGTIQFSAANYNVNEGDGTASITVTRTGGSGGIASVDYATSDGSATAGSDYSSANGTLTWGNGDSSSRTITFPITDESEVESAETVNLSLSNFSGASAGSQSSTIVTIEDNDPTLVSLTFFTATASDGKVVLEWETEIEIDNAGFHLWRSEEEDGEYIRITNSMIPAQGSGSQYSYLDEDAIDDITYYYKLEDIDLYGVSTFHGPISSTAYILITPAEGAVLPIRTPATFEWVDSEDIEGYKLQFSNQSDFSGKVVTRPKNQRKWITSNVYTPTEQKWRAIKRLGKKGQTIFWRVLGKIEDETVIYSETGSLTLEKTQF